MDIKPIQTKYKGYNFRSRLEARWAVFFDEIGIKWEYEVEGFVLSDGTHYLPDFKTTSPQGLISWYDVKPEGNGQCIKLELFRKDRVDDTEENFFTLEGYPYSFLVEAKQVLLNEKYNIYDQPSVCPRCGSINYHGVYRSSNEMYFNCRQCDVTTLCGGGQESEWGLFARVKPHKGVIYLEHKPDIDQYDKMIKICCSAARSARFEHGETPE